MPIRVAGDARQQVATLADGHPELAPWLTLYRHTLAGDGDPAWQRAAESATLRLDGNRAKGRPLLTDATFVLPAGFATSWVRRLLPEATQFDGDAVMAAAIDLDHEHLAALAAAADVDGETLEVVAHLATLPLLRACGRRLADRVPTSWDHGACPICGAWPALAEMRGLERARRLRCGHCGADWGLAALRCPFCGMADHRQLGSLVGEENAEARRVETCAACHGYLKAIATLLPWSADKVPLADLATVELDIAAREHDYDRPTLPAFDLGVRVLTMTVAGNGAAPDVR